MPKSYILKGVLDFHKYTSLGIGANFVFFDMLFFRFHTAQCEYVPSPQERKSPEIGASPSPEVHIALSPASQVLKL